MGSSWLADWLASAAWLALRGPWRRTPWLGCGVAMALEEVTFVAAWLITSLIAASWGIAGQLSRRFWLGCGS